MTEKDTKQRILDAAERLFAEHGYYNTSLRTITGEAHANLAAVNYHFGSKEELIKAVIERRLVPLNAVRKKRLEAVKQQAEKGGGQPQVKDILLAFVEPTLQFWGAGSGAKCFVTLVGRSLAEPDDTVRAIFIELITPLFLQLYELLEEALPAIPKDILYMRLHFVLGALGHIMHVSDKLPSSHPSTGGFAMDARTLINVFLPFVAAGMEAPL